MAENSATIRRLDYKKPNTQIDAVYLTIQLYDDRAVVSSRLAVSSTGASEIKLYGGKTMGIDRLVIDEVEQKNIDASSGEITVRIAPKSVIETVVTIYPKDNTALEGLYQSANIYCTQCEPEGFRHITWYPDRPDMMAVFTTRIEAPQSLPVLLSNGNLIEQGKLPDDRHFATWHDPHKKPSYLFAMVAGDLAYVQDHYRTSQGRTVDLRIYVEAKDLPRTAHAMDSLKRAMAWDEEVYGFCYDLDIFMIVAVSHFNMGAMENKGLNIFNSKYVLADAETASDNDLERVEGIIAHEYFHNWTGNRITCRDWFQLTLKEGLTVFRDQEFTADMHSAGVKRAHDVALLRSVQFPEDASPTAHPIRPESYTEINNFYTPTVYEKGAEVIRMMATILGHDGFMKGIALYVKRHDGTAATCDDFVAAMADANGHDFRQFQRWYHQAGTPKVSVERRYMPASQQLELSFKQDLSNGLEPLVIPIKIGFLDKDDEHIICLTEAAETHVFDDMPEGTVPSYLRGFSAPINLQSDLTFDEKIQLLARDTDSFGRWDAGQSLMLDILTSNGQSAASLAASLEQMLADTRLDGASKAQILRLPSQATVEARLNVPDPYQVWQRRRQLGQDLGTIMAACLQQHLDDFRAKSGDLTPQDRALYGQVLGLAVLAGNQGAMEQAFYLSHHRTMTLCENGLMALNQTDSDLRGAALQDFAERWKNQGLVMEKWLAYEASSPLISTPEHCDNLMQHPAFDANNPNKLRSVLSVFASANPAQFHKDDGSGYRYLAAHIIDIDRRNPQIAARMVLPLTRSSRYTAERKAKMDTALLVIKASDDISSDLLEIVTKSLN